MNYAAPFFPFTQLFEGMRGPYEFMGYFNRDTVADLLYCYI